MSGKSYSTTVDRPHVACSLTSSRAIFEDPDCDRAQLERLTSFRRNKVRRHRRCVHLDSKTRNVGISKIDINLGQAADRRGKGQKATRLVPSGFPLEN